MNEWALWVAVAGAAWVVFVYRDLLRQLRRKSQPKLPAGPQPKIPAQADMRLVFRYVTACAARRWRPVFTLDQFRAIYQAVIQDSTIPHTDSLPPNYDRVTLYGVEIAVSDSPRPPMPPDMLDRDAPPDEPERIRRELTAFHRARQARGETAHAIEYARDLADPLVQAELMYGRHEWNGDDPAPGHGGMGYEAHDLPPRSM